MIAHPYQAVEPQPLNEPGRSQGGGSSTGDGEWNFTWTTGKYGWLERTESGWVLDGRPNAAPDTDWVVAHDIFHHLPGDTGTYQEEVTTFGAETWMMPPDETLDQMSKKLADSWHGVMMLVLENGTRGAKGLLLKPQPDLGEHPLNATWAQAYLLGLQDMRSSHGELADAALWDRLASPEMVGRAVAMARYGYDQARERWPDVAAAREMFERVERSAGPAQDGDRLQVKIQGGRLEIEKQVAPARGAKARVLGR